jgi:predicted kinase
MKTLILMQGASGSGKSTNARQQYEMAQEQGQTAMLISTDDWFMVDQIVEGVICGREYKFDPAKLSQAHAWCFGRFVDAVYRGIDRIIVDNTNVERWQYDNYRKVAMMKGYRVVLCRIEVDTVHQMLECQSRCEHGVPLEVIARQLKSMDECIDTDFDEVWQVKVTA